MNYRRLGKAGLQVSELSFGSWITFANQVEDGISERLMDIAYAHGVNFFDNAEVYAAGKSEEVMGDILAKRNWPRDTYSVSSKAFFGAGGKLPTQRGLHRKHLREACDAALRRLRVDYLDLFYCHRPDKQTPMEETVWTMHHLIEQGKILYWGTSEWSAQEIMEAHMVARDNRLIGPVMEQPQYNMLERRKMEAEYLQLFKTVGLGTTIWSPLASGFLTGKYSKGMPADTRLGRKELDWMAARLLTDENYARVLGLQQIADNLGVSLSRMAIAWCLKNPHVSTVILGASRPEQLEETITSADVVPMLTDEVMKAIEEVVQNKPGLPQY